MTEESSTEVASKELFTSWDVDHSGTLTIEEIRTALHDFKYVSEFRRFSGSVVFVPKSSVTVGVDQGLNGCEVETVSLNHDPASLRGRTHTQRRRGALTQRVTTAARDKLIQIEFSLGFSWPFVSLTVSYALYFCQ